QRLGRRWMCVYPVPSRKALMAPSRIAAGRIMDRGVSCFEWELYSKIKNLDHFLVPSHQEWVFEIHPEVSFAIMNANRPLQSKKKSPQGKQARERLLARHLASVRTRAKICLEKAGYESRHYATDDLNDSLAALRSA